MVKLLDAGWTLRWPVVDVVTAAAGLGSGLEGCQPLFRARGTDGGKEDGCGRSASESNRFP